MESSATNCVAVSPLAILENAVARGVGDDAPERVEACCTVQVKDYSRYAMSGLNPAAHLAWRDAHWEADRASRPAIADAVTNLADYATVFVGYPIWWYREPSIIDTFVESNAEALAGRTIVPFATSGGSGMGDSTANLQTLAGRGHCVRAGELV